MFQTPMGSRRQRSTGVNEFFVRHVKLDGFTARSINSEASGPRTSNVMLTHGDHVSIVLPVCSGSDPRLYLTRVRSLGCPQWRPRTEYKVISITRHNDVDNGDRPPLQRLTPKFNPGLIPNETRYSELATVQLWTRVFVCVIVHEIKEYRVRTGVWEYIRLQGSPQVRRPFRSPAPPTLIIKPWVDWVIQAIVLCLTNRHFEKDG